MDDLRRRLLWHGTFLVLLALLTGAFVAAYTTPRLGLAAHIGGVMNGTLIVAVGLMWTDLVLAPRAARALFWGTVYSGYANWAGLILAAIFGTSRSTPLLGAGHVGAPWQEALVGFCLVSGAIVILIAIGLVLAGLRPQR
jgi:hydroxylaminobenzene mutase